MAENRSGFLDDGRLGMQCDRLRLGYTTGQAYQKVPRGSPGGANVQGAGSCLIGLATPQMTHPNNRPIPSQI